MTPLKNEWLKIYTPLVDHLKLQVRMNVKSKSVEIRVGLSLKYLEEINWMNGVDLMFSSMTNNRFNKTNLFFVIAK